MIYEEKWGYDKSPILVVGDSPTETVDNVEKAIDPNHYIYNSIIVPIKYYTNEYLIKNYKCKLPYDFNNRTDIFKFINAVDNGGKKKGLDTKESYDLRKLDKLKDEIVDKNKKQFRYKIVICMGDFAYFAVKAVLGKFGEGEKREYPQNEDGLYSIEELGEIFYKNSDIIKCNNDIYILPVLHNISNRCDDVLKIYNFIPEEVRKNKKYTNYFNFIGERLGNVLFTVVNSEEKYKKYLYKI